MEQASPHPSPTPAGASTQSGWGILSWANLRGLLDTLNQGDAAQGQRAYVELQAELEGTFKKLQQYLALSPTVALSVASTCRAIQQEIDYVKSQQARPKKRRYIDANQDEDNVLACYKRMRDRLQDLPDNRLRDLVPSLSARYDLENAPNALTVKRGPCTQGTRTNVLDQMYQWVTDQDTGKIYWMSGMAGTGKTTIAYSLCKRLDTGSRRMLGASFFCSRLVPECRNVGKIVPSIAYQLARRSQPFQYALCQAMKNNPDAQAGGPSSQFQLLIVGPLSDSKVREALPPCSVVVIDALDECEDETSTRQILDVLLTHSEGFPIKFVVSSRPEATIRERMARNDDRVVLHELDKKEVQSDIKAYLREGLSRMSPSESEIEKLAERAGVLFIYAATVIRYVGYDDFGRNPRARLTGMLSMTNQRGNSQTKGIDQLYGVILEAALNDGELEEMERDDMKLVLHTVVCAKAPLTVDALNGLLKLDDVDRIHAALRPLWSVLHVMTNMTVTTLHASFPDYLTDPKRSGDAPWHCDAATHHGFLAQKSLERIRDTRPQFNICRLESSYLYDYQVRDLDARVEKYILIELRYACQYWSTHLDACDSGLLPLLEQFLTKQLLLWMEVMNLTKNVATTPHNLTTAKKWAAKYGATRKIVPSIAYQLARRSQPFQYALCQAMKNNPDAQAGGPSSQFQLLIVGPLSDSKVREALPPCSVVVIDALDECEDETSTRQILDVLLTHSEGFPIKFVVSSRPEATIRERMARNDDRVVLHELDKKEVQSDIKAYLREGLSRMSPSEPEIEKLAERAGVLFIYAATVIRYVGYDDFGRNPRARLNAVLAMAEKQGTAQTEEIDQLYGAILESAIGDRGLEPNERDDMKLILHTVVCAKSPLTLDALNGLLKLDDVDRIHAALRPLWSVLHVMGPEMTVTTLHASFFDYLTDRARSGITPWHCNVVVHHGFLAQRSLERIRDTIPQFNICKLESSYLYDEEVEDLEARVEKYIPLELRYACQYWSAHLLFASDPGLLSQLEQFLTKQLLLWMEVMNLTKNIAPSPGHLAVAKHWAAKHGATCSEDCTIRIWDAYSGQSVFTPLVGHTNRVTSVAISPDDTKIVSGSSDSTVRVWDTKSGRLVLDPIKAHTEDVYSVAFAPNNSFIVSSGDGIVRVWDSHTGQSLLSPFSHIYGAHSIAISPDSTCIAASLGGGTILIGDVDSGKAVFELPTEDTVEAHVLAYSSDGTRIISYTQNDGTLCLFDAQSKSTPLSPFIGHTDLILAIDVSPDGKRIVSGSQDGTICVWDPITSQLVLGPLGGHARAVHLVRYSPVGSRFLSCSYDETLRQWDAQTGDCLEVNNPIVDTCTHHGYFGWQILMFVLAAYSPDGNHIATISRSAAVCLWSSKTGEQILGPMEGKWECLSIQFSTDGTTLLTGWDDGAVRIWDVQSGQLVSSIRSQEAFLRTFAFSPDGSYNVVSELLSEIHDSPIMYQRITQTGEPTPWCSKGDTSTIILIQFSHDGSRIVSGSDDNTVHIWDAQTGDSVFGPLKGHIKRVTAIAYSPDGTYIASASEDVSIRVWDVSTQLESAPLIEWVLNNDGWVVDEQSQRLIWVPVDLRNSLLLPRNTALVSRDGYVRLKLNGALIGEARAGCWLDS
ncbi:vegetative incompatibility protein HET-E-1, putative, partial [Rhizoctonia solani AG-3 Rhs1AP]